MKLNEFKAWFEGYTESMESAPSKKQWERIKEQVTALDGVAISYPVYIDRYVRPYYPYWAAYGAGVISSGQCQNAAGYTSAVNSMYEAGKAEALAS